MGKLKQIIREALIHAGPTGRKALPSEWYDRAFAESRDYRKDPMEVSWRRVWLAAINMLPRNTTKVFDMGCGPGQFAVLLRRRRPWLQNYLGVDFSRKAIAMARELVLPEGFHFAVSEIENALPDPASVVTCLEVMEHLDDDTLPIKQCHRGQFFIGSVPGYDSDSHVRVYNKKMATEHFSPLLDDFKIKTVRVSHHKRAFVFSGRVTL